MATCTQCGERDTTSKKGICLTCRRGGEKKDVIPLAEVSKRKVLTLDLNARSFVLKVLRQIADRKVRTIEEQAIYFIVKGCREDRYYGDSIDQQIEEAVEEICRHRDLAKAKMTS